MKITKRLRIDCNKRQWGSTGTPSFPYFFYKLIEKNKDCLWIIYSDCFLLPSCWMDEEEAEQFDKEFYSAIISEHQEGYNQGYRLVNNDFILKYAQYVENDWNVLVCYEGDINAFDKVINETERDMQKNFKNIGEFIAGGREIEGFKFKFFLENWDTMYWDLASFDDHYADFVKEQLKCDKDIIMEEVDE